MIVRITFLDENGEPFQVLFGNSYKYWWHQLEDYLNWHIKWWDRETLIHRRLYRLRRRHLEDAPLAT